MIRQVLTYDHAGCGQKLFGIAAALLCLVFSPNGFAVEQKGSASVAYGMMLDKKEKQQVIDDALKNAVQRWIVEKNKSHYKNYEKVKSDIDSSINDYVIGYHLIDSSKKNKQYSVVVRANINEPKLMAKLLSSSEMAVDGEQKYLTFVFVAREQVGKVVRSEKEASQIKQQTQGIKKSRTENSASQTKSQVQTIGTSKVEKKLNDKVLWDVATANEVNVAMGDVFTEANYLVIDAEFLEEETGNLLNVENFMADYRTGNDLSAATKKEALKGLKAIDDPVHYLAIGTLDVDEQRVNEKTGNIQIAVSITGQVLSVFKRGAAVAKVGPEVALGEGPTVLVAKNNALKNAAEQVASQLVAKLSSKNIR